jgi:hypothetical protein
VRVSMAATDGERKAGRPSAGGARLVTAESVEALFHPK